MGAGICLAIVLASMALHIDMSRPVLTGSVASAKHPGESLPMIDRFAEAWIVARSQAFLVERPDAAFSRVEGQLRQHRPVPQLTDIQQQQVVKRLGHFDPGWPMPILVFKQLDGLGQTPRHARLRIR